MSPYQIDILLWYYTRPTDHPDLERKPPVYEPIMQGFVADGLLKPETERVRYSLTERGQVYVRALQDVPLPEAAWVIPRLQSGKR